jgi:phospholipid/cholesterol/gamma-HCH transport system substrate-binding protein
MVRRTSWTELGFGIVATLSIIAVAVLILVFGRVGQLHGRKFTLYVSTSAARGLIRGSEVWLDGQRVGEVTHIDFLEPQVDGKDRLVLDLRILEEARLHIREDSKVQVLAGGGLLGDQVVYLTSGTLDRPTVSLDDTLKAVEQKDMEGLTSEAALAAKQFPAIVENVKLLGAELQTAEGTLGALGLDHGRHASLSPIRARTKRLIDGLMDANGTLDLVLRDSATWRTAATEALASADTIRLLVTSEHHSLGRFRRDSTLAGAAQRIRDELAKVQSIADGSHGTVGRLRSDSAIVVALRRSRLKMDSLMADMKRHPLRYIAF